MTDASRLRTSSSMIVIAYAGLALASWGILSKGADLATADGRHLLAGALANLCLVSVGIILTITSFRRGHRWAWCANTIPLLYGIPIIAIDAYYVGLWTMTVMPQVFGACILVAGLVLPARIVWRKGSGNGS